MLLHETTAKMAVDNILAGITCKDNIWAINVDDDYHEEIKSADQEKIPKNIIVKPVSA